MARIYGSNRIVGPAGGLRHYTIIGVDGIIAAEKGGANKNLIKRSPVFARTRENNMEWCGVTLSAKLFKYVLGMESIVNRQLIGDLNRAMLIALRRDPVGLRGKRSLFLSKSKEVLDTVKYYYYKPLADIMKCRYEVDTGPDRRSVTVKMTNLQPKMQIKAPNEATHYRFLLNIAAVCDLVYKPNDMKYVYVYGESRVKASPTELKGEWFPVNTKVLGDLTYTASLDDDYVLEEDMTVMRMFGIEFGKMIDQVYPIKKDRGSCEFLGAI
jgi:hypothetical protein